MCFAPRRRALFQHRNFQTCSEPGVSCTFSLAHVLRAATACTFSTSQLPKVVLTWGVFSFLTWKCASLRNGVQFFISHLARWLRTCCFSEPTFWPCGARNHWKNTRNRKFPTFSHTCIFFLSLSLLWSSDFFAFSSLALPTSAFPSVHMVGNLTGTTLLVGGGTIMDMLFFQGVQPFRLGGSHHGHPLLPRGTTL